MEHEQRTEHEHTNEVLQNIAWMNHHQRLEEKITFARIKMARSKQFAVRYKMWDMLDK